MPLIIQHLKLEVTTSNGKYGVEIPFEPGLFILQADNTSGKSTCLLSILYALGLDGMLGPSHNPPLPPVVTECLEYNNEVHNVIESEVFLEISNGSDVITVKRQIKGAQDIHLVDVWDGPMLTFPNSSYRQNSYLVRRTGATRENGFHRFLAKFIGWELPTVPKYNGEETLLYMESIFPLLFVEQKHGWSNLRSRFPTYLQIKDVTHRVVEFICALDAQEIATKKILIKQQEKQIRDNWQTIVRECDRLAQSINGFVENVPQEPKSSWPPFPYPQIVIDKENTQVTVNEEIFELEQRLEQMEYENVPVVNEIVEETKQRLNEKQEQLVNIEIEIKLLFEDIGQQRMHITSIESRITSLRNELQRNKDLKKLSELQGIRQLHTTEGECPTCRQSISDSLITPEIISHSMTIDQNIDFVKEQIKLFQAMYKNESSALKIKERKLHSIREFASRIREEMRALKTTLTSQNNAPSYAFIEAKFVLAMKIKMIRETRTQIDEHIRSFSKLAEEWNNIQLELLTLPKTGILSDKDISKINKLQSSFQKQLSSYGFSSLNNIEDIIISQNIYLPEYEGFDLQIDLTKATSASDYIRVIWAYLLGLLEISRNFDTNHPGLLIMDEPRQQSTNEEGLKAFLNRSSQSLQYEQQVIIATSESDEILKRCLVNIPHTLKKFDGKIISPI